ncbi:hypothetical protein FRC09_000086 [Ceratobasidium sp. 395]|nr:hypothetical protein FRC09_000086 [Ceratobasidium sp. 395]
MEAALGHPLNLNNTDISGLRARLAWQICTMSWDITELGSTYNKAVGKQIAGAPVTPTEPQAQATVPVLLTKLVHHPKPHALDLAQPADISKKLRLAPIPFKKLWAAAAASGVVRTLEESAQVAELHQKATELLDQMPPPDDVSADGCEFIVLE